jgi:flagellum-specific peptidoglycan hydrolase FlgJ
MKNKKKVFKNKAAILSVVVALFIMATTTTVFGSDILILLASLNNLSNVSVVGATAALANQDSENVNQEVTEDIIIEEIIDDSTYYEEVEETNDASIEEVVVEEETEPITHAPINKYNWNQPSNLTVYEYSDLISYTLRQQGKNDSSALRYAAQSIYDAEHEYNVNGLMLLAIGSWESGWGYSYAAYNRNNLFGICGGKKYFNSIGECIDYEADLLHRCYLPYFGTFSSMNGKYCPDDYGWAGSVESIYNIYCENIDNCVVINN